MRHVLPAIVASVMIASTAQAGNASGAGDGKKKKAEQTAEQRLSAPLVTGAGEYAVFAYDVSRMESAPFESVEEIDEALAAVASHSPDGMSKAWLSYGALIAAQTPEFVDTVRATADYYGRDAVLAGLVNDPSYASKLEGAPLARQAVLSAAEADAQRFRAAAAMVKEQAYSLQKTSWAKVKSGERDARMSRLALASLTPRAASPDTLAGIAAAGAFSSKDALSKRQELAATFWSVFRISPNTAHAATPSEGGGVAAASFLLATAPKYEYAVDQVVTLAAIDALGANTPENASLVAPLLYETQTKTCMEVARLHLNQCIAAGHFRYEDPFCIAEHGIKDVANCVDAVGD